MAVNEHGSVRGQQLIFSLFRVDPIIEVTQHLA